MLISGFRIVSCLLVLTPASLQAASVREPLDRPNVVVVFLDDSGYGDYAHHGNPVIDTPEITRLAREGADFTQFHVTSPACSASRYSLLTGRYPFRSGLGSWVVNPESKAHLRAAETTLAEGLKARGYATGLFGKWHLGNPNKSNGMTPDALPLAHGFDTWTGTNVSHDYDDAMLLRSDAAGGEPVPGYRVLARNLPSDVAASTSLTGRYFGEAVDFIRDNKDRPFLACITPNQPHLGLFADKAFIGTSRRGLLGDVMAEIDASVGRLRQTLDECGVAGNTLIFFSSDNGPWIRFQNTATHPEYGEARLHVGYATPFRDGKGSNWEGGHRVAGIFLWPGVIAPRRITEPASTLDLLPTVFALCGAPAANPVDGRDIRPLLAPDRFPGKIPDFEMLYCGPDNQPSAIRRGPWKLHTRLVSQINEPHGFSASREKPLLFQVEHDPGERFERASEQAGTVQLLLERMESLHRGGVRGD